MATASKTLSIASKEVGYSRWDDPKQGTKYGRWYAEITKSSYFGTNGVPYCAMFVAWVLAQVNQKCPGMPTASCTTALKGAKNAGIVRKNKKDAKAGDLVIFDWDGDGSPDHIGFVEKNKGSYIQTIEGNTSSGSSGSQSNGGVVARRTRNWSTVLAIIAVPYSGSSSSSSSGSSSTSSSGKVTVDGYIGEKSNTALQKQLGTTADGIISSQASSNKKYLPNCTSGWEFLTKAAGSKCIVKLQKNLNKYGDYGLVVDGICGPKTITALQKWMRTRCGYVKHVIDGVLGPDTAANIQNALNAGFFKKFFG